MFTTLLLKEIQETIQTYRFLIATILCILFIPLGMYVTMKNYEQRFEEYQDSDSLYQKRAEGKLYYRFQGEGYRPPSKLSFFSIGLEYHFPTKIVTSRDGNYKLVNDAGINNPQSLLFGKIDYLFNVSFVLSILALIFTFSSIAGEKETATFRLIFSNPVPRWMILLTKVMGSYIVFLMPFIVSFIVGILIVALSGSVPVLTTETLQVILFIFLVTLLFMLSMFCLGMLVSSLTQRSLVSIVTLLLVWVVFILGIPKISPMIAEVIYPVRSASVVTQEKQLARSNLEQELDTRSRELFETILGKHGADYTQIQWPPPPEYKAAYEEYDKALVPLQEEYEQSIATALARIDQDYENKKNIQTTIAVNLSRFSPVSCLSYVVTELSGTGLLEMQNFQRLARRFQNQVKETVYDRYTTKQYGNTSGSTSSSTSSDESFDPKTEQVPHLTGYRHTSLSDALESCWVDILLLALYSILFFTAAFVSFLRYDVR